MKATLKPGAEKFVLHWGEMGTRWGVNRTVAQIHALLYLSDKPLNAEDIADTLGVARSNVSNSLHELQSWKLVRSVPVLGDRREHFETIKDVWEMFKTILDGRKQREIDPTLTILNDCLAASAGDAHTAERLKAMKEFFESASDWYADVRPISAPMARKLMRLGGKVHKILAGGLLALGLSAVEASAATDPAFLRKEADKLFDSMKLKLGPGDEWKKLLKRAIRDHFDASTHNVRPQRVRKLAPGAKAAFSAELAPLRNRQWTSAVLFRIGGLSTAVSGQFSRRRNAFFAVYPEGYRQPMFVSIDDMIDERASVEIGGRKYLVTLEPAFLDKLGSKVMFKTSKHDKGFGVSMRKILGLVWHDGTALERNGTALRLFFGQDVDDTRHPATTDRAESVVFITRNGDDYQTYLIPTEYLPTDGSVADVTLRRGLELSLRIANGVLEVY